ncbi:MFS transporter [Bacteroidia bacterium]|nr:MFS transporter [Bacteroidia bacterium]MDA9214164.1 MFS transporter [Bacteroidia bacterium]
MALQKPRLTITEIIWMSFGFMGIQCGFGLQNGNASRILEDFGAHVHQLSWFWIVAPLTGMLVQPLTGHFSDRTWTKLGRRKPYFLAGTIICCLAIVTLPNSAAWFAGKSALLFGAVFLALMDASINVAMEPFRALVADNLNDEQRTLGFSIQTFLIGIGAVLGSWLPYIMNRYFGVSNVAPHGFVPDNVVYSFYFGAVFFFACIMVTVLFAKEYNPEEYAKYHDHSHDTSDQKGIIEIFYDFKRIPKTMMQLGLVQFFSWFGLFCMWVYTTKAVAQNAYGLPAIGEGYEGSAKTIFDTAGDWVGILFGIYNGISAIYALMLPRIVKRIGRKNTHAISLIAGSIGMLSMFVIKDPQLLIYSMIGIGMAWASILAMPYAILAGSIPDGKMGVYMGIFNFFITIPQIVSAIVLGPIVAGLFDNHAIFALVMGGIMLLIAAISVRFVVEKQPSTEAA